MARNIAIRRHRTGANTAASAVGARLFGPSAMGPLAVAVSAVGALAIGRVVVADAVIRKLRAETIEIGSLKVRELEIAGRRWPDTAPVSMPQQRPPANPPPSVGLIVLW